MGDNDRRLLTKVSSLTGRRNSMSHVLCCVINNRTQYAWMKVELKKKRARKRETQTVFKLFALFSTHFKCLNVNFEKRGQKFVLGHANVLDVKFHLILSL